MVNPLFSGGPRTGPYITPRRNPDPAPVGIPDDDKSTGSCNFCGWSVLWDDIGMAAMESHFKTEHPDKI